MADMRPRTLRRLLPAVAVATFVSGCASTGSGPRPTPHPSPGPAPVGETVSVRTGPPGSRGVTRVALETYVEGVVAAELSVRQLPPGAARAMLELQAVLARTFAVAHRGRHAAEGFDLCAGTHCQLYQPERVRAVADVVVAAVAATRDLVLTHEGRPIVALYHADCGGRTSTGEAIWGGAALPYLRGVDDHGCLAPPRAWRFEATAEALAAALAGEDGLDVGGRLDAIDILETDDAGRVTELALEGSRSRLTRGEGLRRAVMAAFGPDSIRSPRFAVARDGQRFIFEGRGLGHGAGLCQRGALARLAAGETIADVLLHYYPGTRLTTWSSRTRVASARGGRHLAGGRPPA
jgi:stage II sporulation protein D